MRRYTIKVVAEDERGNRAAEHPIEDYASPASAVRAASFLAESSGFGNFDFDEVPTGLLVESKLQDLEDIATEYVRTNDGARYTRVLLAQARLTAWFDAWQETTARAADAAGPSVPAERSGD